MPLKETKVYFDGSHYICIPHTTKPKRTKKAYKAELPKQKDIKTVEPTAKEEFDRLYQEYVSSAKNEKKRKILEDLASTFKNKQDLEYFVENNMERKNRNRIVRRIRLMRKVYLQTWTHFCTFTYSDKKQTEESFRRSLHTCLRHLAHRKGWKYIGAWERGKKTKRLHFHAIVYIPDGQMIGEIIPVKDYDVESGRMQETMQNSHFIEKYGRNDFQTICKQDIPDCVQYLIKYIEKDGGKIVYSRGLPMYIKTDVFDEDIICEYGLEGMKFILFDDFTCIDDGEIIGKVSPEVIAKMPKSN